MDGDSHGSATPPGNTGEETASLARRLVGLGLGLALFMVMLLMPPPEGMTPAGWRVAAIALLMAVFWVTEAVPIAATALIPIAGFPLLGVSSVGAATAPYANPLVFLFMGGFVIALAMERWNLHVRIALFVLRRAGSRMDGLIAGFMAATAFLSMWVSNTATTLMMLPIALSVVKMLADRASGAAGGIDEDGRAHGFAAALLLSVAYGASIGGIATLVGTPPNAFLAGFMLQTYGLGIGFGQWMAVGLPLSVVMLVAVWWLVTRVVFRLGTGTIAGAQAAIGRHASAQGPMSRGEKLTAILFTTTAALWVVRPWIEGLFPGGFLDDTVIAMTMAVAAFLIPVDLRRGIFLMNWETAKRLPWGVLILFGGGLTLANAIATTGVAEWIGARLIFLEGVPVIVAILVVVTIIIFLTELTSNTATTAALLPVVAVLALTLGENPLLLAVPAALAASCAFMLPVATPPNAIVFASGYLTVPQMARAGFLLNVAGVVVITACAYSLMLLVFGIEPGTPPTWAPGG